MTTDLDALIAEAREWARKAAFVGRNVIRDLDRGIANTRRLVDALESTLAELRQERERADGWREEFLETAQEVKLMAAARDKAASQRNRAWRQRDEEREAKAGNARLLNVYSERLSRAEETIEKIARFVGSPGGKGAWLSGHFPDGIRAILTEYDKQKGASDD